MRFESKRPGWLTLLIGTIILTPILFWSCEQPNESLKQVRVGAILPLTGPAGQYGTWVQRGLEVAKAEVAETYPEVEVEVLYEDTQGVPRSAVAAFQKLAGQGIDVAFVLTSGETLAVAPLAEEAEVVIMTGTLIPGITEKSPLLIRNAANMATETRVMADHLASQSPPPRVGIILVNNEVGTFSRDRFTTLYEERGGEVVGAEAYAPDATDFRPQLSRLASREPDVLYILSYAEWGTIVRQAQELGMNVRFAGATPIEDAKALEVAGSAAEGIIYTKADFDPKGTEVGKDFQRRFEERFGEVSEVYAATFRDNLHLVARVVQGGASSAQEIVDAIVAIGAYDGASGRTVFLPNRDVEKPVALFTVKNGKFQRLQGMTSDG